MVLKASFVVGAWKDSGCLIPDMLSGIATANDRGKKYATECMRDLNATQRWRSRHLINTHAQD